MDLPPLHITTFDYDLPDEQIAKYPLEQRSASKLLYYKDGVIQHKRFKDLPELLPPQSMLVFNNTRVIEARLLFKKATGSAIEIFLLNPADHANATTILETHQASTWQCMIGNKKRWKENEVLHLSGNNIELTAQWKDREKDLINFQYPAHLSFQEVIHALGSLPIPPYLNRPTEEIDLSRYQTSFAAESGSVAAPTAALHFDESIYAELSKKSISCQYLTLHVGAGTFKPLAADNVLEHTMHEEYMVFPIETIRNILLHEGPRIAVGTTSLRSLESLYWFGVGLQKGLLNHFHIEQYFPYTVENAAVTAKDALTTVLEWMDKNQLTTLEGTTSIYIVPGYQPKMVKGIVTNFHQPRSTLLMLIAALVGDNWKCMYATALENKYRFLSYGDSSLILF